MPGLGTGQQGAGASKPRLFSHSNISVACAATVACGYWSVAQHALFFVKSKLSALCSSAPPSANLPELKLTRPRTWCPHDEVSRNKTRADPYSAPRPRRQEYRTPLFWPLTRRIARSPRALSVSWFRGKEHTSRRVQDGVVG